jgi:hypothetical protein
MQMQINKVHQSRPHAARWWINDFDEQPTERSGSGGLADVRQGGDSDRAQRPARVDEGERGHHERRARRTRPILSKRSASKGRTQMARLAESVKDWRDVCRLGEGERQNWERIKNRDVASLVWLAPGSCIDPRDRFRRRRDTIHRSLGSSGLSIVKPRCHLPYHCQESTMSASMKTNNHECKSHPANYVIQPATTSNCVPAREGGEQLV